MNYFTQSMKKMAHRCGFINATRCTGQGKQLEGISRMVNSKEGIPVVESMRASRHKSVDAHLGYAEPDEEAHAKRYQAMAARTVKHEHDREDDGGGKMTPQEYQQRMGMLNPMMGMGMMNPMMGMMNPMMGMGMGMGMMNPMMGMGMGIMN